MKVLSALTTLALGALPVTASGTHGDPYTPIGTLDVDKLWVAAGLQPELTWQIRYPQFAEDLVSIQADDSLITKERSEVEIRVAGAAFQIGDEHTALSVMIRIGASSEWQTIYLGSDAAVRPDEVLYRGTVEAGTRIDIAAAAQDTDGNWIEWRDTQSTNATVEALVNGESLPSYVPAYEQGDIVSFLTPWVDENNVVQAGPRDVIHAFELYATDTSNTYFDQQDMLVVTTFNAPES